MPIQRNPEDVVAVLLERLAKGKHHASELAGSSNSQIQLQFQKIEKELQDVIKIFPRVKRWEELVMEEIYSIGTVIADNLDDCKELKDVEEKFQTISRSIENIKILNSPIQLHSVSSKDPLVAQMQQVSSEERKMSEDWKKLCIEENILKSAVMANLQASYAILEIHLKVCLLCFSVFPENAVVKTRSLIYWWIGEGLVTHTRNKTAEEVGELVVKELMEKGMIEIVYKNKSPMASSCMMNPWIRRMIISVAKRVGFFNFDDVGNPTADPVSRRGCFVSPSASDTILRQEELLTLFNVNENYLDINLGRFSKQRKLLVLQLGRWQNSARHHIEVNSPEFLNALGVQKHLKYLSLRGISRITDLPDSIAKLTNLKILDLRACHNLEQLPSGIKSMKKLTHLDVSECYLLEYIPTGIESLSELQVLKGFIIGNSSSKDPCQLKELAVLKKLRKLSINVGTDAVVAEEELGQLQNLEALRILSIRWGGVVQFAPQLSARLKRAATMSMVALTLPKNLEKLDLRCFPQNMSPNWLRPSGLQKLEKLYIMGGKLSSFSSTDSETWNVKVLRLKFLADMVIEWSALQEAFPRLIYLEKIECERLISFPCDNDGVWVHDKQGNEGATNML